MKPIYLKVAIMVEMISNGEIRDKDGGFGKEPFGLTAPGDVMTPVDRFVGAWIVIAPLSGRIGLQSDSN